MGGGSKTTTVAAPAWLEDAAKYGLARAEQASRIGYTPYYGPDVAAMTPMQIAGMQGTNTAAGAFGLGTADPMAGMPQAQNFNGMAAYSSGPMYDQALAELERRAPGQYAALRAPFIDPVTGGQYGASSMQGKSGSGVPVPTPAPVVSPVESGGGGGGSDRGMMSSGGGGRGTTSMATPASYLPGGVNTRNPNSVVNRVAAALSRPQGAPTQANRPVARSVATDKPTASVQASMAKAAAANAANKLTGGGSTSVSTAAASAANRAAASKAQREAGEGKGGKSGPKGGGSSGGSNRGRR